MMRKLSGDDSPIEDAIYSMWRKLYTNLYANCYPAIAHYLVYHVLCARLHAKLWQPTAQTTRNAWASEAERNSALAPLYWTGR